MDLKWEPGSPTVRWAVEGREVVKAHLRPVRSAAHIADPPSVVIVEDAPKGALSDEPIRNAVVYEVDGSERLRLDPPTLPPGRLYEGFDQCFPDSNGMVIAVYIQLGELVWAYADVRTGELGTLAPFR